jgi:hypothetical protein
MQAEKGSIMLKYEPYGALLGEEKKDELRR